MKKYFFDTDGDSHHYLIPADRRQRWEELNTKADELDTDSDEFQDVCNQIDDEFGGCRLGGGSNGIEFYLEESEAEKLTR